MRRKRRLHKPGFKATVVLTAIRSEMTMAQMVKKYDVQAAQITQWKNQLMNSAEVAFDKRETAQRNTTLCLSWRAFIASHATLKAMVRG